MTPPTQSGPTQPGMLQRQNDGMDETGSQVKGSIQFASTAAGLLKAGVELGVEDANG